MSYICCLIPKIWPHLSFGPECFIPHSFLFSCPLSPLFLFGSPVISSSFLYHTRLTCFCYSFIPSSIFLWVPIRSSFIPTLFLFPSSLPSFLSLFLPSGDAAKRKAWKLNRVSSLRSIYTNSLQNSEGKKKKTAVVGRTDPQLTSTLTLPPLQGWSPLCWRFVLLIPGMNELVICRKRWWNWVWVTYMFKQEALRHFYNMKANSLMNHQLRSKREN